MNNLRITAADKRFKKLERPLKSAAEIILRFLDQNNTVTDIFLINSRFMKKNVLAYPAPERFPYPDLKGKYLGEIYLNPGYIRREKLEIGNWKLEFSAKLIYMFIHGLLHLLGYDHEKKSDRMEMEKKEAELLSKIPNYKSQITNKSKILISKF